MPADSCLEATFWLAADGSITLASAPLLQLRSAALSARLAQLSDLIADGPDADRLLQWLRKSTGVSAWFLQTHLLTGLGNWLAVELWATALPVDGSLKAFCALRLPQGGSAHAAALALQVKRQSTVLQQLRQDQAALLASEFRWRFAVEGSGEGVWDWDINTGTAFFSPLWKRLIGYGDDQISSRFEEWRDRIHPQDLDRVLVELNQYLESDIGGYRMEFRMRCKDGSYAWILSRGMAAVRDREGRPLRIIGTHRNITERKHMETELRIAAAAFDASTSMLITDENQVIQRVNQAFVESTGYAASEVLGRTPRVLRSGKHNAAFYADMWRSIAEKGSWQGEVWGRRKNKEQYLKWLSISVVRDASGCICHYIAAETDISARKQAECALQKRG